jgi:hypothetical protein
MLMAQWVWVLEEFDRVSGKFRSRHRLADLSDEEARLLVGLADLGEGDLFDLPSASLAELSPDMVWSLCRRNSSTCWVENLSSPPDEYGSSDCGGRAVNSSCVTCRVRTVKATGMVMMTMKVGWPEEQVQAKATEEEVHRREVPARRAGQENTRGA